MRSLLLLIMMFSSLALAEPQWGHTACEAYSTILNAAKNADPDLDIAVAVMQGRDCKDSMSDEECVKHMSELYHDCCELDQGVACSSNKLR